MELKSFEDVDMNLKRLCEIEVAIAHIEGESRLWPCLQGAQQSRSLGLLGKWQS